MIELIHQYRYLYKSTYRYLHLLLKLHVPEKLLNEICAKQLCFVSAVRPLLVLYPLNLSFKI